MRVSTALLVGVGVVTSVTLFAVGLDLVAHNARTQDDTGAAQTAPAPKQSPYDPRDDVSLSACVRDRFTNSPTATIDITNRGPTAADYWIYVSFTFADGKTQLGTASATATSLAPGQVAHVRASMGTTYRGGIGCTVASVDRIP